MHADDFVPMPACALPDDVTPDDVADAAREAFVAFCRGVAEGWTKRDLATWLVGPYGRVAHLARFFDARAASGEHDVAPPSLLFKVDVQRIAELLDPAWQDAVTCVQDLASGMGVAWMDEAFELGSVVEAALESGETMFVPVHRPRLTLGARVRSLVVADFLLRPEDYRGEVHACEVCGVVLLGAAARERGQCTDHLFHSGMRPTADGLEIGEELLPASLRGVR